MTNYLLIYDLPVGVPVERYTKIREALELINAVKVAYSTFHVSYAGDLRTYLSPLFTSDDRVIIAPYSPYLTQMQKGKEPADEAIPYQPVSIDGMNYTSLGLLPLLSDLEPAPTLSNVLSAFYGNALEQPKRQSLWGY
jgi:hypothetical protein